MIALAGQDKSQEVIVQYIRLEELELPHRVYNAIAEHAKRTKSTAWNINYEEEPTDNETTQYPSETTRQPQEDEEKTTEEIEYHNAVHALMNQDKLWNQGCKLIDEFKNKTRASIRKTIKGHQRTITEYEEKYGPS